jgi:hypothetical protein
MLTPQVLGADADRTLVGGGASTPESRTFQQKEPPSAVAPGGSRSALRVVRPLTIAVAQAFSRAHRCTWWMEFAETTMRSGQVTAEWLLALREVEERSEVGHQTERRGERTDDSEE